jgi:drug/metabolite transporter (DMT)-like permease
VNHPLGQACALLTAIIWGYALVLFKRSGEEISPVALNLFKNTVGLILLLLTLAVLVLVDPRSVLVLRQRCLGEITVLLLSGVLGIAVADTLFFRALHLIGVGLISVADCSYAPCAVLFSWWLLGEQLTVFHYVGAALVVAGVFLTSRHTRPAHRTRAQIVEGMLLAIVAVGMMALGIVMAKPVLEEMPVLWSTTLRLAAGLVCLALFALLGRDWQRHWSAFRPSRAWRAALPASVLGTYVCLILWVAGFKYTYASVAALLNQTSVVFASLLAAIMLKERFGVRQVAALLLAMVGVVTVTFGGVLYAWLRAVK